MNLVTVLGLCSVKQVNPCDVEGLKDDRTDGHAYKGNLAVLRKKILIKSGNPLSWFSCTLSLSLFFCVLWTMKIEDYLFWIKKTRPAEDMAMRYHATDAVPCDRCGTMRQMRYHAAVEVPCGKCSTMRQMRYHAAVGVPCGKCSTMRQM